MIRRTSETSNVQRPTSDAELSELSVGRSALSVERLLFEASPPDTEKSRCARYRPAEHARRFRAASRITISPAITRISLLATARSFPASIAASAGRNPPVPTIATSTMSASVRQAISRSPASPEKICGLYSSARAGCRSLFRRPDKQIARGSGLRPQRVFRRCCSRRARRSPSAPEYRAPLSARSRRSNRSRPEQRRVCVHRAIGIHSSSRSY